MPADRNETERLLGQDARIRRLSRMVPARGPLPQRLREEIIASVVAYMRDAELSQADVARAIGTSTTYVNNVLNNTGTLPEDTRDQVLRDANNWLDREARARESRRPAEFVETRVAQRIIALAERLKERADLALAYGPAGIGKTLTAQAIAAELGAVYIMIDEDCQSPVGLRIKLFNALSRRQRSRKVTIGDVVEKLALPERVATRNLVIIDEAHDLRDASFTMLRKIAEQARCSLLFLGTVRLEQRLSSDDDPEFGQLSSRIGIRVNLARELTSNTRGGQPAERLFTIEDIRALFGKGKLKLHPSTARMLATIANSTRGTLRRVERLYFWALKAAVMRKADKILPEHVEGAAAIVGEELGVSAADILADAAPEERKEAAG